MNNKTTDYFFQVKQQVLPSLSLRSLPKFFCNKPDYSKKTYVQSSKLLCKTTFSYESTFASLDKWIEPLHWVIQLNAPRPNQCEIHQHHQFSELRFINQIPTSALQRGGEGGWEGKEKYPTVWWPCPFSNHQETEVIQWTTIWLHHHSSVSKMQQTHTFMWDHATSMPYTSDIIHWSLIDIYPCNLEKLQHPC